MSTKTVAVTFNTNNYGQAGKQYNYLTTFEVKVGDTAVVESPNDGFVTVTVRSVSEGVLNRASKYLVQVVDTNPYKEILAKEARRREVLAKLEAKKKAVEELHVWQWLAEQDSEAKELLEELKSF